MRILCKCCKIGQGMEKKIKGNRGKRTGQITSDGIEDKTRIQVIASPALYNRVLLPILCNEGNLSQRNVFPRVLLPIGIHRYHDIDQAKEEGGNSQKKNQQNKLPERKPVSLHKKG